LDRLKTEQVLATIDNWSIGRSTEEVMAFLTEAKARLTKRDEAKRSRVSMFVMEKKLSDLQYYRYLVPVLSHTVTLVRQ
jgi:ATP-dependent Zn protease